MEENYNKKINDIQSQIENISTSKSKSTLSSLFPDKNIFNNVFKYSPYIAPTVLSFIILLVVKPYFIMNNNAGINGGNIMINGKNSKSIDSQKLIIWSLVIGITISIGFYLYNK